MPGMLTFESFHQDPFQILEGFLASQQFPARKYPSLQLLLGPSASAGLVSYFCLTVQVTTGLLVRLYRSQLVAVGCNAFSAMHGIAA